MAGKRSTVAMRLVVALPRGKMTGVGITSSEDELVGSEPIDEVKEIDDWHEANASTSGIHKLVRLL